MSEAADRLYATAPDEFVALRAELVKAAEGDDAKAIKALRKPTVSASVVNRYVHSDPHIVGRLSGLGDRLRQATKQLDAAQLRELSTERRSLVAESTKAAFTFVGTDDPPAAQRDEVSASFDAAVADPDIAQQLGRLVRPARFDGFGVVPGPELTLVRGGRKPAATKAKPAAKKSTDPTPRGDRSPPARRLHRAASKARDAFDEADAAHDAAAAAEQKAHERVGTLTDELTRLQQELDEAKRDLDRARKSTRTTKSERRVARTALDKAERQLEG